MNTGDKYKVNANQGEHKVLPNKLGITRIDKIEEEEAKGFINASVELSLSLDENVKFDYVYIMNIHRLALEHLYEFAGQEREVNMSKGGFSFPPARFLKASMLEFDKNILSEIPSDYSSKETLIEHIGKVHGELLYIHPFREGNGRTARLLANLMAYKAGYDRLKFEKLDSDEMFNKYIDAIQKAGLKQYQPMIDIISLLI
ncbi:Fic/DOC family protein [Crocinitomix catalasitica]|uniref:Fic/DOC family protein n=1 Tax=Crocinitomix catalasitica TaxID=184607 RepID=UPI00048452BA|nr:Fic family protein [Crocinitomix catalasitica]